MPTLRGGSCTIFGNCYTSACAVARESLRQDRPGGLTSPAFHACDSASPLRAHCCHSFQYRRVPKFSPYAASVCNACTEVTKNVMFSMGPKLRYPAVISLDLSG